MATICVNFNYLWDVSMTYTGARLMVAWHMICKGAKAPSEVATIFVKFYILALKQQQFMWIFQTVGVAWHMICRGEAPLRSGNNSWEFSCSTKWATIYVKFYKVSNGNNSCESLYSSQMATISVNFRLALNGQQFMWSFIRYQMVTIHMDFYIRSPQMATIHVNFYIAPKWQQFMWIFM